MPKPTRDKQQAERTPVRQANNRKPGGPAGPGPASIARAIEDPAGAAPEEMLSLQRTAGNRAVSRLVASAAAPEPPPPARPAGGPPPVQFKLMVGPAGDQYEQEADRVADHVLRMPAQAAPPPEDEAPAGRLQRKPGLPALEEEKDLSKLRRQAERVQRRDEASEDLDEEDQRDESAPLRRKPADPAASFEAGAGVESQLGSLKGGGHPLPDAAQKFMAPRFGADFSGVRVHTDAKSADLNRQLSAQAFTHGSDIYFGAGKYNPGSSDGNRLLAHELTHVVQQRGASARAAQAKRQPNGDVARQPAQPAPAEEVSNRDGQAIQRVITSETSSAFFQAVKANPKYEHGKKLVDKFATPVAEPGSGDPPPWQTEVAAQLAENNVTADEQDKINKVGRTHGWKFWKQSDLQEFKLKGYVRAYMLWDFASRTNQLRPEATAKYGALDDAKKKAKRKGYMKHAGPFQEKYKGLIALGPAAPETKAFLEQEGFLAEMKISDKQNIDVRTQGPRIDVRSTFIGGPILGIHLRAHLFIVYTGRDGKQFYFRGGPGGGNPKSGMGFVKVDFGEYKADTVDYDPSAPSVTVMQGPEAEAKLDAMISASKSINTLQVPYVAQVATALQKKVSNETLQDILGVFGTRGENCNRAAWTILTRAGVPTNKPVGKHPGWGMSIGADTPGKENARPAAEVEGPGTPYALSKRREIVDKNGLVQVYHDRMFYQKSVKLGVGERVQVIGEDVEWRKIRMGDEVGYIAKNERDVKRGYKQAVRAFLQDKGWLSIGMLDDLFDEIGKGNYDTLVEIIEYLSLDMSAESSEIVADALKDLYADLGEPAISRFQKALDKMSDDEVRVLQQDPDEFMGLVQDIGIEFNEAMKLFVAVVEDIEAADKVRRAAGERLVDRMQINLWVNHLPDYSDVNEIAAEAGQDFDSTVKILDQMRPPDVRGHFLMPELKKASLEQVQDMAANRDYLAEWLNSTAVWLGVPREFVVKRAGDFVAKVKAELEAQRLLKEQEEARQRLMTRGELPLYRYQSTKSPVAGNYKPEPDGSLAPGKADLITIEDEPGDGWISIIDGSVGSYYWVEAADYQRYLHPPKPPKTKSGWRAGDVPGGKHKLNLKEAADIMVGTSEKGPFNIRFTLDPGVGGIWLVVFDEMTEEFGAAQVRHNGKQYYAPLENFFDKPDSEEDDEFDEQDDEEEVSSSVAKEEPKPVGGILAASPENPITLQDQMRGEDIEEFTAPRRIQILDENWPDKVNDWDLVFVKDLDGGQFGSIYANKLKAHYKEAVVVSGEPEDEGVIEGEAQVIAPTTKSGWSKDEYPSGALKQWPWDAPVTLRLAATVDGPFDIEKTMDPGQKWKKIQLKDDLTEEYGRAMIWYGSSPQPMYIALEDIYGRQGVDEDEVVDQDEDQPPVRDVPEPQLAGNQLKKELAVYDSDDNPQGTLKRGTAVDETGSTYQDQVEIVVEAIFYWAKKAELDDALGRG
jgi:hypothetical protein